MIEVERKFPRTETTEAWIKQSAKKIKEKTFTDAYYDTPAFELTTHDFWLRKRGDRWELKVPLHAHDRSEKGSTVYNELETEEEIAKELHMPEAPSFEESVQLAGYVPCCVLVTHRETYEHGSFKIDVDHVTAEDGFDYGLFEIELGVETEAETKMAEEQIKAFAEEHGIPTGYVRGKILEYLKQKKPNHFAALVASGVASAKEE